MLVIPRSHPREENRSEIVGRIRHGRRHRVLRDLLRRARRILGRHPVRVAAIERSGERGDLRGGVHRDQAHAAASHRGDADRYAGRGEALRADSWNVKGVGIFVRSRPPRGSRSSERRGTQSGAARRRRLFLVHPIALAQAAEIGGELPRDVPSPPEGVPLNNTARCEISCDQRAEPFCIGAKRRSASLCVPAFQRRTGRDAGRATSLRAQCRHRTHRERSSCRNDRGQSASDDQHQGDRGVHRRVVRPAGEQRLPELRGGRRGDREANR
jgi:hypothetical protein